MLARAITSSLLLALSGCASGTVCMAVSVDWEGATLEEADLAAMEALERAHPDVPLTHFLNAAYFTKRGADPEAVRRAIARVVRPIDEVGLHVHAWDSLMRAAGVEPREGPSFLGEGSWEIDGESGWDIELEAYAVRELEAVVRTSIELLRIETPRSFRGGLWLVGPRTLEAVRRVGIQIDSSAMDPSELDELAGTEMPARMRKYWPNVVASTQPFIVETAAGPVLEAPITGGVADYVTSEQITAHVEEMVKRALAENRVLFAQVALHQEGAADFADRVARALGSMKREHLLFDTLERCAARVTGRTW